jgi:hypothetical protein
MGATTLTASAPGYSNGTANVTVGGSAFVFVENDQPKTSLTTTTLSGATTLTVGLWQLAAGQPSQAGTLRPGATASVTVSKPGDGVGTIFGSPVAFAGGDSVKSTAWFTPNAGCSTPCNTTISITQPLNFTPPGSGGSLATTVNKPSLTLQVPITTIGQNLQVSGGGSLDGTSSSSTVVHITSDNANVVLSSSPTTAGTGTLDITIPPNASSLPHYWVQAKNATTGSATLTGTLAGYDVVPITVYLAPAGFVISGNQGVGADVGANMNSNVTLTIMAVVLDPTTLAWTSLEESLRGGITAKNVNVTSDNGDTVVTNSPVVFSGNMKEGTVTVHTGLNHPNSAGISISTPSGFSTPSTGTQLNVVY